MLNNKIIVVTGGAGLLGSCFCSAIANRGGTAIVADLNLGAAETVAKKIMANGVCMYVCINGLTIFGSYSDYYAPFIFHYNSDY